jgi:PEP-CTERM motif
LKKQIALLLAVGGLLSMSRTQADTIIADWTFETSLPATSGPFSPEVGSGSATAFHAGATTYSHPAGNGSAASFSSSLWAVGDYYQVQVSTVGFQGIFLTYDQVSSGTGPGKFLLQYSTDGTTFTPVTGTDYTVLVNAAPNAWSSNPANHVTTTTLSDDLSAITTLNNAATVYFRFSDDSTTSANGGTVATSGTGRIDNIIVAVPEPSTFALFGLGAASLFLFRRRK